MADSGKVRTRREGIVGDGKFGNAVRLKRVMSSELELALQVVLGNLQVPHRHADVFVPEQFLDGQKADAEAQHFRGAGVSKAVRGNALGAARPLSGLDQSALEGQI
jgi:hypothetical protein